VRLLAGSLLRGGRVDRDPEARVAVARVPRVPPRLAVRVETRRQLGNVHAAQSDEDGQAHPGDPRERLRRGRGHPDRRVRLLIRARDDGDIREAVEPALVAERLALPGLEDDLPRLQEARLAPLLRDADAVVGARTAAAAYAD